MKGFRIEDVRQLAWRCGWKEVQFNEPSLVLGYVKDDQRVNVYYTTGARCFPTYPRASA